MTCSPLVDSGSTQRILVTDSRYNEYGAVLEVGIGSGAVRRVYEWTGSGKWGRDAWVTFVGDCDKDGSADFVSNLDNSTNRTASPSVVSSSTGQPLFVVDSTLTTTAQYRDTNNDGVDEILGANGRQVRVFSGSDGHVLKELSCAEDPSAIISNLAVIGDCDGDAWPEVIATVIAGAHPKTIRSLCVVSIRANAVLQAIKDPRVELDSRTAALSRFGKAVATVSGTAVSATRRYVVTSPYQRESGRPMATDSSPTEQSAVYELNGWPFRLSLLQTNQSPTFGWSVCSVGDVDADGIEDYAVGDPEAANETGVVHVCSTGKKATIQDILAPFGGAQFGFSVISAERVAGSPQCILLAGCKSIDPEQPGFVHAVQLPEFKQLWTLVRR